MLSSSELPKLIITLLLSSGLALCADAQVPAEVFLEGDQAPIWMSLDELNSREQERWVEVRQKFQMLAERSQQNSPCLVDLLESSVHGAERELGFAPGLGRSALAIRSIVSDVVPGVSGSNPASLVVLDLADDLRGHEKSARLLLLLPAFDAELENGLRLCYQQGVPRVPDIGDEVYLFRAPGSPRSGDLLVWRAQDRMLVIKENDTFDAGPIGNQEIKKLGIKSSFEVLKNLINPALRNGG